MELIKNIFDSWQLNVILAITFSVIYVQYYKLAAKDTPNEWVATIILELLGALGALVMVPFFAFKYSLDTRTMLLLLVACIFYALNDGLKTVARKKLEVSVFSIIDQLTKVFLIIYGIVLFHNEIVTTKLIGGALIIFGNVALFYNRKKIRINKYVWLSMLTALLMATALAIDVDISTKFNLPFYVMLTLIIPAIFNYALARCPLKNIIHEFNSSRKKNYLISGLATGPMIFFVIRSLQLGQMTFIAPLLATTVLLNVLVASVLHKEKTSLNKKIAIAVIIIIGVFLTVI